MYLISYDVVRDRPRQKIAKELENFGNRVQYSVFECRISPKQLDILYPRLVNLLDGEEGSIRVYSLCEKCTEKLRIIGDVPEAFLPEEEGLFIV